MLKPIKTVDQRTWSFRQTILFWWVVFVLLQQTLRFIQMADTPSREPASVSLLLQTLWFGFRGDLIIATLTVLLAIGLAFSVTCGMKLFAKGRQWVGHQFLSSRVLRIVMGGMGVVLLTLLTIDMGYYHFNQHHLDFVFFEYVVDLVVQTKEIGIEHGQAARQTQAELGSKGSWGPVLASFYAAAGIILGAWWLLFSRVVRPTISRWAPQSSLITNGALMAGLVLGAMGLDPEGFYALRIANISSLEYYMLSQNPILYASQAFGATLSSQLTGDRLRDFPEMPVEKAVPTMQQLLDPKGDFAYPQFPLVRAMHSSKIRSVDPVPNILMILVEGLDRRFLNQEMRGIQVTPFLDALQRHSFYFENFYSSGTQTARGLFASFCSYYPRQGQAAMKTRYAYDYPCLPTLLRNHGYRNEMVTGENRDLNRLQLFATRNGFHQLFDMDDFPEETRRIGVGRSLGISDGDLLDLIRERLSVLQGRGGPFFLTTITLSTHHPFLLPETTEAVRSLRQEPDGYVASLRYFDQELERFFTECRRAGLLKNTIVMILGDHGRHEVVGRSKDEKQMGHFLTPLYLWFDPSLRFSRDLHPRRIATVASQVDLVPTLLGLTGLTPRIAPFLGHDLSCLLVTDCAQNNFAFLSSVYDDLIALVDRHGLLVYSLRTESWRDLDYQLEPSAAVASLTESDQATRRRNLFALYVGANTLLEQNRIWSWKEFGAAAAEIARE
jgi:phosphoglycerol transferase MdoB-like AlkP superfamily enzyme